MTKRLAVLTTALGLACALAPVAIVSASAQHADKKAHDPAVTGSWSLEVHGGAHGVTTMGLTLEQEGKRVKGTFASPHGDMPVSGEFVDGTLTLQASGEGGEIRFSAKVKDHDTLTGYISSAMGDMTFTATRLKDK